jgi:hypothetical protein
MSRFTTALTGPVALHRTRTIRDEARHGTCTPRIVGAAL